MEEVVATHFKVQSWFVLRGTVVNNGNYQSRYLFGSGEAVTLMLELIVWADNWN